MMKKLKERWNVTSNFQLVVIFIVFAITGFSSLKLAVPFMQFIGLTDDVIPHWLYRVLRLILIFPIYQILLVTIGSVLGQFKFFWWFEKKMLRSMKLGFIADFLDQKFKNKP